MTHICQEAPLGIEQVLQPPQCLVKSIDELTDLIIRVALIRDTPGQVIRPGDLERHLGYIAQGRQRCSRAVPACQSGYYHGDDYPEDKHYQQCFLGCVHNCHAGCHLDDPHDPVTLTDHQWYRDRA